LLHPAVQRVLPVSGAFACDAAMDIPYTAAHGTIRFSFSRYNTMAEVDEVLKVMPGIVATCVSCRLIGRVMDR